MRPFRQFGFRWVFGPVTFFCSCGSSCTVETWWALPA